MQSNTSVLVPSLLRPDTFKHFSMPSQTLGSGASSLVLAQNSPVLPPITSQNDRSIDQLMLRNGNLTEDEERYVIRELRVVLRLVPDHLERLEAVRRDITEYDPYSSGYVDATTFQRTCAHYFRGVPLSAQLMTKLVQLFARNRHKPRQINYEQLINFAVKVLNFHDDNNNLEHEISLQSANGSPGKNSMAQSPLYARGDAKLILELESLLKAAGVSSVDSEKIGRSFNIADRMHQGTVNKEQIETVLSSNGLGKLVSKAEVMSMLLQRCEKNVAEGQYDWATVVRFLDKSQPVAFQKMLSPLSDNANHLTRSETKSNNAVTHHQPHPPLTNQNSSSGSHLSVVNGYYSRPAGPIDDYQQKEGNSLLSLQNSTASSDLKFNPMPDTLQNRVDKQKALADIDEHIKQLTATRQLIKRELDNDDANPGLGGIERMQNVVEALSRADRNRSGWIPLQRARQIIASFTEMSGLNVSAARLESVLSLSADQQRRLVNLDSIAQYLPNLTAYT